MLQLHAVAPAAPEEPKVAFNRAGIPGAVEMAVVPLPPLPQLPDIATPEFPRGFLMKAGGQFSVPVPPPVPTKEVT